MITKICKRCKKSFELDDSKAYTKYVYWCRRCKSDYNQDRLHRIGKYRALGDDKNSSQWLGIHIAEKVLSKYFDDLTVMPYGNPGYDYICKRGFKIDVKCSTIHHYPKNCVTWRFFIKKNQIADYFLCLGFDTREDLNPVAVWLIPGRRIGHISNLDLPTSEYGRRKWAEYETPIDKVIACCNTMKNEA